MERTTQNLDKNIRAGFDLNKYPLVEITRTFRTPMEQVWKAWTTPELAKQWWSPENYSCPDARIDFREGGKIMLAMKGPDGKIQYSGGVFQEIIPMTKFVMTDQFMDPNGHMMTANAAGMPGDWPDTLTVTVNFEKIGDGETRMSIVHEGIPKEMHDDCVSGWSSSFDKLQRLVERS